MSLKRKKREKKRREVKQRQQKSFYKNFTSMTASSTADPYKKFCRQSHIFPNKTIVVFMVLNLDLSILKNSLI